MGVASHLTELVSVYRANSAVKSDLNVVPAAVTLVISGLACNIHRGTDKAQDVSNAAGVLAVQPGFAYFAPESRIYVSDRWVILDEENVAWLIHGQPAVRTRFAATAHVRCLISRLLIRPAGLP
jgi:hypothetical protein